MTPASRGILAMSASVVVFIFNDALIKLAAETMPPLQAIGLRGVFATLWCGLLVGSIALLSFARDVDAGSVQTASPWSGHE